MGNKALGPYSAGPVFPATVPLDAGSVQCANAPCTFTVSPAAARPSGPSNAGAPTPWLAIVRGGCAPPKKGWAPLLQSPRRPAGRPASVHVEHGPPLLAAPRPQWAVACPDGRGATVYGANPSLVAADSTAAQINPARPAPITTTQK
jgi:hypothetical protein